MSNPFAALAAVVDAPSRMELKAPGSDEVIRDAKGNPAYIDMLSPDSASALAIDRANTRSTRRKLRTGNAADLDDEDFIEDQVDKLVAVTVGWYLVNPATKEPFDVPFSKEAARQLYADAGMGWVRRRAWAFHNNEANFMQRSPKA